MVSEKITAYETLQSIITIFGEMEAILDVAIDYSTSETEQVRKNLTPLLMTEDRLLNQVSELVDNLEMVMGTEVLQE